MMMYKVIKYFTDLQDNGYAYNPGDVFPREGMKASKSRLEELSSGNNRQNTPLIKAVEVKSRGKDADKPLQRTE